MGVDLSAALNASAGSNPWSIGFPLDVPCIPPGITELIVLKYVILNPKQVVNLQES